MSSERRKVDLFKNFIAIKPEKIKENPFQAIGGDGMLIAAGKIKRFNMMTASWGGFGVLWHKNVCFCFVRPQRYTYVFMEASPYFTLNFFGKKHKKMLEFCGTKSGRDVDKMKGVGLTALRSTSGAVYFQEAKLILECRKIYFQQIDPQNFLDAGIRVNYPKKDYHRMYVGEVVRCLVKG